MLLSSVRRAALAATIALLPAAVCADDEANPQGQSTFISPSNDVAFAFTVPDDGAQTFFSIRVPRKNSWGAIGLGNNQMTGSLCLIIYQSGDGKNVTFSPRVAYGNYEPEFYSDFKYDVVQNSTGIFGDYMYFTAVCTDGCRNWPNRDTGQGGYISVTSPQANAIYAVGPEEGFYSDSQSAALKFHREFGVFTLDMKKTNGVADTPVLNKDSQNEGTALVSHETGKSDYKATLHATFMIFFIIVLMNVGIVIMRVGGWARWHAVNQMFGVAGTLAGLALGVLTSFHYQRSRSFNSYHQIIGYIVVAAIFGQLGLGITHHLEYRKTQAPTKFGRIHLWLGRGILGVAIINAFFGFAFAGNRKYGAILAGLMILVAVVLLFFMYYRKDWFRKRRQGQRADGGERTPWRDNTGGYSSAFPAEAPPGYEPPPQQVGLEPVVSSSSNPISPWKNSGHAEDEDEPALGSAQKPREFA